MQHAHAQHRARVVEADRQEAAIAVEDDGEVVGYGWMDTTWGEAEILLAVDPAAQANGVGSFILDHLEKEASAAGLNYMYNVVRDGHPEPEAITAWLEAAIPPPSV